MSRGGFRTFYRGRGADKRGQGAIGPPDQIVEIGAFVHAVEDEMFCASVLTDRVPHFNAPVYLQNKSMIGKIDEILGPINEVYFSVKMSEGMVASSFKKGDMVYIGGDKLLPIERFLPKPKLGGVASMVFPSSVWWLLKFRLERGRGTHNTTLNRGGRGRGGNFQRGGMRGGRGTTRGFLSDRGRGGMRGRGGYRGRGSFRGSHH